MHVHTARLELRVMELEDAVKLLTGVAQTMNDMLGHLNEVNKTHTRLLGVLASRLDGNDDDDPDWERFKG